MSPSLKEGDVVWAHQRGYPWWPAVLTRCPVNPNQGEWKTGLGKKTKFHCIFLEWNRERSWLLEKDFRKFERKDGGEERKFEYKVKLKNFKDSHLQAIELALEILDDHTNPMMHLEKIVNINEFVPVKEEIKAVNCGRNSDEEDLGDHASKISKKPVKKAKKAGSASISSKIVEDKMTVHQSSKVKSVAGFFQTIAEKVKNPRNRKPVEKFSSHDENIGGKIGKIKKFHQKSPALPAKCQCAGCLLADCGDCRFCQDMVCFGGEGRLGKKCSRKVCMGIGDNGVMKRNVVGNIEVRETIDGEEGIDIIKNVNKGRRANIIDVESQKDSDEDEIPLVINFDEDDFSGEDNNTPETAVKIQEDKFSPTYGELPTSSSISYQTSSKTNEGAATNSVWDEVKDSLLDVEDSLIKDLAVGDSTDDEFSVSIHPPPKSPSCSPPHSQGSAVSSCMTISTPESEGKPGRGRVLAQDDKIEESVLGLKDEAMVAIASEDDVKHFHVDDIDEIIEANINVESIQKSIKELSFTSKEFKSKETDKVESSLKSEVAKSVKSSNKKSSKSKSRCEVAQGSSADASVKVSLPAQAGGEKKSKKVTEINMFMPTVANIPKLKENLAEPSKIKETSETSSLPQIKPVQTQSVSKNPNEALSASSRNPKLKIKLKIPGTDIGSKKFEVSKLSEVIPTESQKQLVLKDVFKSKSSTHTTSKVLLKEKEKIGNVKKDDAKVKKLKDKMIKKGPHLEGETKVSLPEVTKSLGSFKIPKGKSKPVVKEVEEEKNKKEESKEKYLEDSKSVKVDERDSRKRSRKELQEDLRNRVGNGAKITQKDARVVDDKDAQRAGRSADDRHVRKDGGRGNDKDTLGSGRNVDDVDAGRGGRELNEKAAHRARGGRGIADKLNVERSDKKRTAVSGSSRSKEPARNWVAAVDWPEQAAPDSTTIEDEVAKKSKIIEADDASDCSSDSRDKDDTSWKRKKTTNRAGKEDDGQSTKKVKLWIADQNFANVQSNCVARLDSYAPYIMSREILDSLGPDSLFDSHCHLDFILFWRLPQMELESFDQFVHAYPLMDHNSLEGFITNFCSPKLWLEHLVSPSPLIHSLLSRPSVHYTIGCHPHYVKDLLIPHNYRQMEKLIEKAGSSCVAVGECGLDTSGKNNIRMSDQVEIFKKQVKLAIRLKKPIVLHIRGAEEEALRALAEVNLPSDWPIHRHCWNDTWEVCKVWLDSFPNSVVGITPLVTFPRTQDLARVVKLLPLDKMVLETDAPYFLPKGGGPDSFLGHTTREFSLPVHVANVAAQVAAIRDCHVEEVLRATRRNVERVYRI